MNIFDDTSENSRGNEKERVAHALNILESTAVSDKDPLVRKHALYMLGTSKDPSSTDIFIHTLYDPEKAVRNQAVLELVGIGAPVIQKIIPLLNDKDWKVRYRAAEVLGMLKTRDAVQPLTGSLSDEKDHVRYMAAKSLGSIEDPAALESLRKCLSDENSHVRKMVEKAIMGIEENNGTN